MELLLKSQMKENISNSFKCHTSLDGRDMSVNIQLLSSVQHIYSIHSI